MHTLSNFDRPASVESEITIERTGDPSCAFAVMDTDAPWLVESMACNRMHGRGTTTFLTALRAPLTIIFNHPGYLDDKGGRRIASPDLSVGRSFVEELIRDNGGRLKRLRGGRPGFSVRAQKRKRRRLALIVMAIGALVTELKDMGIFLGTNPILLEGWEGLDEREKVSRQRKEANSRPWQKRFVADTGRFYRFGFDIWVPVRTSDTRCYQRILAFARKVVKHAAIELYVMFIGKTGCRPGEPQWFTFRDWFTKRHGWFSHGAMLRSKGDDGEPDKEGLFDSALIAHVIAYIDGERKAADPQKRGMVEFQALAKLAGGRDLEKREAALAELGSAPLILNSQGRRLTYATLWHHLKAYLGDRNDEATLHWLRHEYVFTQMRRIEALTDKAEQERERRDLCAYMGWRTGEAMLECYDAYEASRRKNVNTLAHMEKRAKEEKQRVAHANDNRAVPTSSPALDQMFAAAA